MLASHHAFSWLSLLLFLSLPSLLVCDEDYYKTLDVTRRHTTKDIKKQFRKLASIYHPDKNPGDKDAHDKFIEINRAYEVLSNDDKRRVYNQYGEEGVKEHEKNEAARNSRGRGGGMFDFFGGGGRRDEDPDDKRGEDIEADIWLQLREVYNGHIYDLSILRYTVCTHCFGNGADSDDDLYECRKCGGTGTVMQRKQVGMGFIQQVQSTCPKCGGQGKIIKKECRVCGGQGVHEASHTYWLQIERGVPDGYKILLENECDEKKDSKGGHLTLVVRIMNNSGKRNTGFIRDAENVNDLHYYMRINLLQALVGYDVNITHLDGHVVNVNNLPEDLEGGENSRVTKPMSIEVIEGEGMPIAGTYPIKFGDLHVHFEVVFPEQLSDAQQKGIAGLF